MPPSKIAVKRKVDVMVEMNPILEFPDYCATSDGKIWSIRHKRFLRTFVSGRGRIYVHIREKKKTHKIIGVHRLVAMAFIPNPLGKKTVNHKDFDPKNNKLDNLEWMTIGENMQWDYDNGRREAQRENARRQVIRGFDYLQIHSIRSRLSKGDTVMDLAREFGVHHGVISKIKLNKSYREPIYQISARKKGGKV